MVFGVYKLATSLPLANANLFARAASASLTIANGVGNDLYFLQCVKVRRTLDLILGSITVNALRLDH